MHRNRNFHQVRFRGHACRAGRALGRIVLANGVDLATVSERLGHSSVRVTAEVYSHAIRGRDREAADLWDQIKGRDAATRQTAKGVN